MERPAQREPDLRVAIPAEVDDGALGREQVERQLEAGGRRTGVDDQVAAVGGAGRQREVDAERCRHARAAGIDVHQHDLDGEPAEQASDAAADHAGADDRDPVADQRSGVPQRVDGRLDDAREHGAAGRHVLGHHAHRRRRDDVGRLVRVQAEHRAAAQLGRPLLDRADAQVAVLERPREVPLLERRPHRGVLVRRHAAPVDKRLGAAADARAHGAHHHVVAARLGQPDRPDLPVARFAQPERVRHFSTVLARISHQVSLGVRAKAALGWRPIAIGLTRRPRAEWAGRSDTRRLRSHTWSRPIGEADRTRPPARPSAPRTPTPAPPRCGRAG